MEFDFGLLANFLANALVAQPLKNFFISDR